MKEEEFCEYLTAYVQASTGFGNSARWSPTARGIALLAVAGHDVMTNNPPRTPAELASELDRLCVGVTPKPPVNG